MRDIDFSVERVAKLSFDILNLIDAAELKPYEKMAVCGYVMQVIFTDSVDYKDAKYALASVDFMAHILKNKIRDAATSQGV